MVEVNKCLKNISPSFTWNYFKQRDNPNNLGNTQLIEQSNGEYKLTANRTLFKGALLWNSQIILRKQNPIYISKMKFGNGHGVHVLVASSFKSYTFKNVHMWKKLNLL